MTWLGDLFVCAQEGPGKFQCCLQVFTVAISDIFSDLSNLAF